MLFIVSSCMRKEILSGNEFAHTGHLANAKSDMLLDIPTYDGSGQAVHPDVIYLPRGTKDYRFYMVFTPYPWGDVNYENPSLVVSNDGVHWQELEANYNPLVPPVAGGFNNDPEIYYHGATDEMLIIYQEYVQNEYQKIKMLRSQDMHAWTSETVISYQHTDEIFTLSPTIVKNNEQLFIYYVNIGGAGHVIQYRPLADANLQEINHDINDFASININTPTDFKPWHININEYNGRYYMLICGWHGNPPASARTQDLYIATSTDLLNWEFATQPLIAHSTNFHNSKFIYRSSGLVLDDVFYVYYSCKSYRGEWQIGLHKFSLAMINALF